MLRRTAGLCVIAIVAAALTIGAQQYAPAAPSPGRRLALLVGVTSFIAPAMQKHNLRGPANDVALFRTLLTSDRFRIPPEAIVALAGLPDDEARRPIRANIEREFKRLRDQAGPGDQVLILLAGHGSQQPADADPADPEPDGLDEVFLPADTEAWDASARRIPNAIVDDDLRQWLAAIRSKGAIVTIIVDACHSGTITRGGPTDARDRGIKVDALVPPAALADLPIERGTRSSTRAESRPFDLADGPGDFVALYAADMAETTPELPLPDRSGPTQGLFTYSLTRVLMGRTEPITYRELVHRVIDQYQADGFNPTPSLEGAGVDREVLGERTRHDRPTFAIDTTGGATRWTINGGSIHGLTSGSILEVLPPGDRRPATPTGYLRVSNVRPTTSTVQPIAFAGTPAPRATHLTPGHRARVRHSDFGPLRLRVALQQPGAGGALAIVSAGRGPRPIERALTSLPTLTDGLVQRVSSGDADWLLRVASDRAVLTPGTRTAPRADASPSADKRFDVGAADDPRLAELLADRLRRVARAANLSRLSAYVDPEADLQVRVLRYKSDPASAEPLPTASGSTDVIAGEHLQFIVRNTGLTPLDITVLYVDANFGIWPLFPASDSALDNRLAPGEQRALNPVEITADPVGWESVVAIGVEATPKHENFLMLTQDSLPEARRSSSQPASPVRALLESAMYGTRSATADADADRGRFAIVQTWFRVEAGR